MAIAKVATTLGHRFADRVRSELAGPGITQAEQVLALAAIVPLAAWGLLGWAGFLVASGLLSGAALAAALTIRARDRQGWVTTIAMADLRRAQGWTRRVWLLSVTSTTVKVWWTKVSTPSRVALAVIAAVTLAVGAGLALVTRPLQNAELLIGIWQVQAAIAAFAMPVLLFIIELARDDEAAARRTAEVLIRETLAFPITGGVLVLSLLLPVAGFTLSASRGLQAAAGLLSLTIALVVFAYWRVLSLLFDQEKLRGRSIRFLVARFQASMDEVINLRVCTNILVERASRIGIEYSPLSDVASDPALVVLAPVRSGRLTDININRLEQFIGGLPWKTIEQPGEVGADEVPDTAPSADSTMRRPAVLLLKVCGDYFTDTVPGMLALDRSRFSELQIPVLERDLAQALRIVESQKVTADLRRELAYMRESLLRAIRAREELRVNDYLDTYKLLIETFIRKLHSVGAHYDERLARREVSALPKHEWRELDWIQRDLTEIFREAFEYPHQGILSAVTYFPMRVAQVALLERDYLAFARLSESFPDYAYTLARRLTNEDLKNFVIDRVSRHLVEFSRFHVYYALRRAAAPADLELPGQIAEGLLRVFSRLLKNAFEARRLADFQRFMGQVTKLNDRLSDALPGYELWERELGHGLQASGPENTLYGAFHELIERLRTAGDVVRFGLNAWILQQWQVGRLTEQLPEWSAACGGFGDFPSVLRTYLVARRFETQDQFGWDWWITENTEEEVAVFIDFDSYVDRAFIVHALGPAAGVDGASFDSIPTDRSLKYIAEPEGPLRTVLGAVLADLPKWGAVLPHEPAVAAERLSSLLDRLCEREAQRRSDFIISTPLSPGRIEVFKKDIVSGYAGANELLTLIARHGVVEHAREAGDAVRPWGFNLSLPKDIFIDDSDVAVEGFGRDFGSQLAFGIAGLALDEIVSKLGEMAQPTGIDKPPIDAVLSAVGELKSVGMRPVILLLESWRLHMDLYSDRRFRSSRRERGGLLGSLDETPVYSIRYRAPARALIADLGILGRWERFFATPAAPGDEALDEHLLFSLAALTEDDAKQWVAARPQVFRHEADGVLEPEAQAVRRLMGKVHFRLTERARFVVERATAGRIFVLAE